MAKTRGKSVTDGTEKKLRNLKPLKPGREWQSKGSDQGRTQSLALEADFTKCVTDKGGTDKWRENARHSRRPSTLS